MRDLHGHSQLYFSAHLHGRERFSVHELRGGHLLGRRHDGRVQRLHRDRRMRHDAGVHGPERFHMRRMRERLLFEQRRVRCVHGKLPERPIHRHGLHGFGRHRVRRVHGHHRVHVR